MQNAVHKRITAFVFVHKLAILYCRLQECCSFYGMVQYDMFYSGMSSIDSIVKKSTRLAQPQSIVCILTWVCIWPGASRACLKVC